MEKQPPAKRPLTAKRQKILDKALAQLRKSRAAMDPKVMRKIREIVMGNPAIMKKLGMSEKSKPAAVKKVPKPTPKAMPNPVSKTREKTHEKIDPANTMEVMAKLMALDPSKKENIKSAIKKATD